MNLQLFTWCRILIVQNIDIFKRRSKQIVVLESSSNGYYVNCNFQDFGQDF